MYRIVAIVLSLLVLMKGSVFGEMPIFTAIGNFYPSTVCKLGSQVTGRVETVFVQVGDPVKKGQPLVQLDKRPFEIEFSEKDAILQSAKIELQDAQLNYQRMKKLWQKPQGESPSISQKQFEEAKMRYEQAKVQVIQDQQNLNRAKLNLEEATIRASFDGVVSNKFVDPGEAITNNLTYLVEIQSTNPLFLEFSVPQAYLNAIKVGTPISFEVEGSEKEKFQAKINLIYPCIDETTGTVTCRAIIDNSSQELHPGSLAKVEIHKI